MSSGLKNRLLAAALLLVGVSVLATSVFDLTVDDLSQVISGDAGEQSEDELIGTSYRETIDLLGRFGSFDFGQSIHSPFGIATAEAVLAAAPLGETLRSGNSEQMPTELDVRLVMVSGPYRRAIVDGLVVGVGDRVRAGVIRRIEQDGIQIDDDGKLFLYGVGSGLPEGFRATPVEKK